MYLKVFLASLAATVWNFFGGWAIYGIALAGFYDAHTNVFEGLMKEQPDMMPLALSCFAPALLIALIASKLEKTSLLSGAMLGGLIGFLIELTFVSSMFAFYNLYHGAMFMTIDALIAAAFYSVSGAIIGAILGIKSKA